MKKYLIIGGGILGVFLLILLSVFMVSSFGGGPRQSQEQVELVWWKPFQDSQDVQPLIEEYRKLRPNVQIKYAKKNIAEYEQELLNAIASGNSPDIFSIHNDWLPKHSDKLAPLAQGVSERQYRETFVEVAAEDFIKGGQIYAVPLATDSLALYYNKDILDSAGVFTPPATWPEVVSAVQRITQQDASGNFTRSGIALGTSANINRAADIMLLMMLQNGTAFYDESKTSAVFNRSVNVGGENVNPGALALEFYTQFANPSKRTYTWNVQADNSVDAFAQGKLGMMLSYSYMIPTIKDKAPNLNWGVAPAPQADATGLKFNYANYWGEGVSKASANQEYAWDFLQFISGRDVLRRYHEQVKAPSSRKDLLAEQASDVELGVFAESAITARPVYKPDANRFEGIILKMIDDVVLRGIDPEKAVNDAASQVNLLIRS